MLSALNKHVSWLAMTLAQTLAAGVLGGGASTPSALLVRSVLAHKPRNLQNEGMTSRDALGIGPLFVSPVEFFRQTKHLYEDERVYVYNALAPAANPPAKYARRFDIGPVRPADLRDIWPVGTFRLMMVKQIRGRPMLIRQTDVTVKHGPKKTL